MKFKLLIYTFFIFIGTPILTSVTPETATSTTVVVSTTQNAVTDSEQKPVSLAELKKAIEEYDKVNKFNDDNQPLLKRDLWIALGMKYGLKCNDNSKQAQTEIRSEASKKSNNLEKILQILKDGEVVERNTLITKSDENLQWFKLKIPKEK
ncbi:uncharacterized protein [Battus philenor]|uniref:uncharacterized protein n=1 Tax=Battus philenor TaxID=42288 RepID=UPI0035CEE828